MPRAAATATHPFPDLRFELRRAALRPHGWPRGQAAVAEGASGIGGELMAGLELDDASLVLRIAGGDRDALGALYDRHAPLLLALGRRLLRGADPEDLVHDVFLEAWRAAGSYDARRAPVRAWLTVRLRSRARDRLRGAALSPAAGGRDRSDAGGEEAPPGAAWRDDPGRAVDQARAVRALASLPDEQRRVIELAYLDGLSCAEMAQRLDVPLGTVKSRAAAALARLRAGLGGDRKTGGP
jgi:RNA polymerase sigma-70 factor (ECF subfamily)